MPYQPIATYEHDKMHFRFTPVMEGAIEPPRVGGAQVAYPSLEAPTRRFSMTKNAHNNDIPSKKDEKIYKRILIAVFRCLSSRHSLWFIKGAF